MDYEYMKLLAERYKYFDSKKITDLKKDEIQEYVNLIKEMESIYGGFFKSLEEVVTKAWNNIKEIIEDTPEYQAQLKYNKRVKDGSR